MGCGRSDSWANAPQRLDEEMAAKVAGDMTGAGSEVLLSQALARV